jgi:glycosyltransferase involved in cell wall biosynthesis
MSEAKGVHLLAEAFARTAPANVRLEIVGPSYDNQHVIDILRGLAAADQRIQIRPPAAESEVPTLLASFDVLCLPSLVPETFSLVLHEGFAAGLPCLVSDLGYPPNVVHRYHCGKVIRANDIQAWSDAIASIAADPSVLARWQRNVPMPMRIEEEAFLYSHLYQSVFRGSGARAYL